MSHCETELNLNELRQFENSSRSFIALMALLMSMAALAVDAVLPALGVMAIDLGVSNSNDIQLVISSVFLGMAFGIIFFGPFSDAFGRKQSIYIGIFIYTLGCLISVWAPNLQIMILGRGLQGFGAASCRVTTLAMVRDRFEGEKMAKAMSLIIIVFMIVPAFAPSLGQLMLNFVSWHSLFYFMLAISWVGVVWLALGQEETLLPENRRPWKWQPIKRGAIETLKTRVTRDYMIMAGLVFGAFLGYLSSAQQLLQVQYELDNMFAVVFGLLAMSIGFSSFINSKLIDRFGMEELCMSALKFIVLLSSIFMGYCLLESGKPPLVILLGYLVLVFFALGILFGNFNALAMKPLGHIAGLANSVVGFIQTLISTILGGAIGRLYNGTVFPLVAGFLFCALFALVLILRLQKYSTMNRKVI